MPIHIEYVIVPHLYDFECFKDDWPQVSQSTNPLFGNTGY